MVGAELELPACLLAFLPPLPASRLDLPRPRCLPLASHAPPHRHAVRAAHAPGEPHAVTLPHRLHAPHVAAFHHGPSVSAHARPATQPPAHCRRAPPPPQPVAAPPAHHRQSVGRQHGLRNPRPPYASALRPPAAAAAGTWTSASGTPRTGCRAAVQPGPDGRTALRRVTGGGGTGERRCCICAKVWIMRHSCSALKRIHQRAVPCSEASCNHWEAGRTVTLHHSQGSAECDTCLDHKCL